MISYSWRSVEKRCSYPCRPHTYVCGIPTHAGHQGRGALFLSADLPDWCLTISAVSFAYIAELLAIHAGLHLLSTFRLRGTVYTDCLSVVKKISRRWSPGSSFQEAGAALVASCRAYLSDSISLKWTKGHPERSEQPPSAWSRHQWGIYLADAISKNKDIGSLPRCSHPCRPHTYVCHAGHQSLHP